MRLFLNVLLNTKIPVILLINKIDTSNQEEVELKIAYWKNKVPNSFPYVISALEKFNVKTVFDKIIELLPEGPAFYPKDQLTDKPERFFVNEKITRKDTNTLQKRDPICCRGRNRKFY